MTEPDLEWPPVGVPIVDEGALDAIREVQEAGAPDLIGETVDIFLATTPPRVAALTEAIALGDRAAIRAVGHAIKGSCWLLGLQRLGRLCEALECSESAGSPNHAASWIGRLREEYGLASEALRRVAACSRAAS